jgi:hypothetical protein
VKYSKRDRALAIEALLACATDRQQKYPRFISTLDVVAGWPARLAADAWWEIGCVGDGTVDADRYGAAASLLHAGWTP